MLDDLKLLVVDDEETICEGCRRIFTRQGFTVEKCSDACEGLSLAQKNDYSAILLDIKMPTMDGIEFLAALRKERADVPVVLMTGYPSIPNAASAVRLGASDYVTKPFTPEEISQAVHRLLHHKETPAAPLAESPVSTAPYRFWKDSWYQTGDASAIRVGSVPSYAESSKIQSVTLPRIGEVVYQGLPLAAVTIAGRPQHLLPSPLSGVIVSVNEALVKDPALLVNDPCGNGWIACLSPTRFEDEGTACRARCIILYNPEATAATQADKLRGLGCEVQLVRDSEQLDARLNEAPGAVVIVDGPAAGGQGPEVVGWINTNFPAARVIVVAGADANL